MGSSTEKGFEFRIINTYLNDTEKQSIRKHGYWFGDVFSEGSCSVVYYVDYFSKTGVNNFSKDVPLKLACKVMETQDVPKDFVNKFLVRELDVISRLCHPHIIQTHSIAQLGTKILIFMRNAEYGNLCNHIIKFGLIREKMARVWFRQLALALEYLHILNIGHRDIKCENILITVNNNVKLCDFGFARFAIDNRGKEIYSATYCGSLGYSSPEIIKGIPYDIKISDVWSLGVVLYVMINGIMPFNTANLSNLWASQNEKDFRFRKSIITKISSEVQDLVSRMLEPNWHERIRITDILKHEWICLEPKLLELTVLESDARDKALAITSTIRPKPLKKIINIERTKTSLEIISEKETEYPSFDQMEAMGLDITKNGNQEEDNIRKKDNKKDVNTRKSDDENIKEEKTDARKSNDQKDSVRKSNEHKRETNKIQ